MCECESFTCGYHRVKFVHLCMCVGMSVFERVSGFFFFVFFFML